MASSHQLRRYSDASLLVWGEVSENDVDLRALNNWWTNEHLPERLSIPGFYRARRYEGKQAETDQRRYLALYEVASLATLTSNDYMAKLNNPTAGTRQNLPTLARMNRAACRVLGTQRRAELRSYSSLVGGCVIMLETKLPVGEDFASDATDRAGKWFERASAVDEALLSYHFLLEDQDATTLGSSTQSYHGVKLAGGKETGPGRMILLIEGTEALEQYMSVLDEILSEVDVRAVSTTKQLYQLLCSLVT